MKASPGFKTTINNYLQSRASQDPLFAETLKKPAKSLDDCINYIFGEVQKSGINGYADEEIFGMAVHYYDEDDIKPGKAVNARVVVNHHLPSKDKQTFPERVAAKIASAAAGSAPEKAKPTKRQLKEEVMQKQVSLFG